MSSMAGFAGKKRAGGKISSEYKNNCGHPNGSQNETVSPQPKKILTGDVTDKVVQPSKKAELSR